MKDNLLDDKFTMGVVFLIAFCIFNTFPVYFILGFLVGIWTSTKYNFKPIIEHYNVDASLRQFFTYMWRMKDTLNNNIEHELNSQKNV